MILSAYLRKPANELTNEAQLRFADAEAADFASQVHTQRRLRPAFESIFSSWRGIQNPHKCTFS